MEIVQLISSLGKLNIYLQAQGAELKIKGSKENLTPAIVEQIRQHKAELIRYLGAESQAAAAIPLTELNPDGLYPVSLPQRTVWVMSQLEGGNIACNIPGTYVFKGRLDTNALNRAFEQLIARHESLRTVFVKDERGELWQRVLSAMPFTINYHDLQQAALPEDSLGAMVQQTVAKPFDLSSGPLLRASLFRLSQQEWVFTYVMHHIVSDGWSMGVLMRELLAFYNAYTNGTQPALPALRIQYKDYTAWQRQQLSGASLQMHRDWWLKQFEGEIPVLELPADYARPAVKTFNGRIINRKLNADLTAGLKAVCRAHDATLYMGLLAAVNTLLYRYTQQNDIVIGSPIAGRQHPDLEGQIGFYVNTLALRMRLKEKQNFHELLAGVKTLTLEAYQHQAYPFDELVEALNLSRDLSRHPLFDVMVVLQNAGGQVGAVNGLTVQEYKEVESMGSRFDWLFIFVESGGELQVSIEYNRDIYSEDSLARAWTCFEQLVAAIIPQPTKPVAELDYLTTAQKNKLLIEFNDTTVDYPKHKTIAALFEEQVAKTPAKTALVFGDVRLSYQALNEQSNRFAAYLLHEYGLQPDDLVAIKLERSEWLIIAILGVLKAGAAYVPIDTALPQERIDYMVADTNCKLLIDERLLAAIKNALPGYSNANPVTKTSSHSLAYVMYTSGSTGKPKGVMAEQRGVLRLVKSAAYAGFTGNETLLSTGAVSFDATSFEYWGLLLNGGKLVMCSMESLLDAKQLSLLNQQEGGNMMWLTSGLFNQLVDKNIEVFNGLETVLTGGEKLSTPHVRTLLQHHPGLKIIHCYGPTENTTFSLTYPITSAAEPVPIGKPISNSTAYIIDKNNQLCPVGVTGEICVGGDGLARGYLNQPGLTAEKFVPNPYIPGQKMYRSGDLGRWQPDGNILFEGRKDNQVKIRGYRIEPGEVESVIRNHPSIESAVVMTVVNAAGEKELAAYFVAAGEATVQDIRGHAAKELPSYMVPAYFVQLDALPLTPNGKVDRKSLPNPFASSMEAHENYVAPRNALEEKLAAIWQEILGREKIGIKDHFFECGGHSLKLSRLNGRLQEVFEVAIPLKELFANPVLEQQAALIQSSSKANYQSIPALPLQEHYPLSAVQRRMWILSQFQQSNIAYNIPSVYEFEGSLDIAALEHAFHALSQRHESLRTVFRQDEAGEVRQYVLPTLGALVAYHDNCTEEAIAADISQPFDLATGPLLRASLYRVAGNKWFFVFIMHHIISDGWSMTVLMNELLLLYNARIKNIPHGLQPLRIQYRDYAAWQQARLTGEMLSTQKDYWLQQLELPLPVLDLPQAKSRPARKTFAGAALQKRMAGNLQAFCTERGSTLFMGLLAGVNALLYAYSKQGDIIIGTPIAGREHPDLEGQVGLYINTLALRTRFSGSDSFESLLFLTKQVTLGAYEHQAYPFDELVEQLGIQRDASRNALFDVMVVLQNMMPSAPLPNPHNLQVSPYQAAQNPVSAFDLTFSFVEQEDHILAAVEYNTDLYTKATVQRMADNLEQLLQYFIQNPSASLDSFTVPASSAAKPATQRKKLLIDDLER